MSGKIHKINGLKSIAYIYIRKPKTTGRKCQRNIFLSYENARRNNHGSIIDCSDIDNVSPVLYEVTGSIQSRKCDAGIVITIGIRVCEIA